MLVTTVKSNAGKMTVRSRQRAVAITPAVLQAETTTGRAMVARARELSHGTLSAATLKLLGHPYSTHRFGGMRGHRAIQIAPGHFQTLSALPINMQSGNFQWRWQMRVTFNGQGSQLTLFNTARYAKHLATGTDTTVPRPILEAVIRMEQGPRFMRLAAAMRGVNRLK